ncbi:SLC13 family permease [Novispirillum itersonii]|uniref:SLC13 family permease n=1 Tax=Novispirillum itersonii TaxID=189 RepID=UPI0003602044|nr:SLC13 family permease [Novispirillum itersonii]
MSEGLLIVTLAVFALVYLGMAVGRIPGLQVDRTGIAVLGAIILVAVGAVDGPAAVSSVDFPALLVLAGLMVVSAQAGEAGLYDWCAARLAVSPSAPPRLLGLVVFVSGGLSALVTNDVVVFAVTPLLCVGLLRRGLDPRPFVLALALAANAGSALTPIGNPQNILIAQAGALPFWPFVLFCLPVALASLLLIWGGMVWLWRGRWRLDQPGCGAEGSVPVPVPVDRRGAVKTAAAAVGLLVMLSLPVPQALGVTVVAGALLISRRLTTRRTLLLVDWPLLVLFAALFIVTHAAQMTGVPSRVLASLGDVGLDLRQPWVLTLVSLLGSNTIGNVPADMLVLSLVPDRDPLFLHSLALLSTLAGNLLITGSMANIIAVEAAARQGVRISFLDHARSGVPLTLITVFLAALQMTLFVRLPL